MTALEVAPIVTAAIAAVSAGLSWMSVRQARAIWSHSQTPLLSLLVQDDHRFLTLHVGNASKTLAVEVGWGVLWGDRVSKGPLPRRFLEPDRAADIRVS